MWYIPSAQIPPQIASPVMCIGIETSVTCAPSDSSCLAAARTVASTSGSESYRPNPSETTAMRNPAISPPSASV